jgi:serine/threonine protein kinase/Tol biopolymer transport system component
MALTSGTRLGPYEILSPLGAGGMGEVYRARDARLGREVAVKVLPDEFAKDPDRLRRFEGEARAASALSDPHIVTVFDIGREKGVSYFATELVEGTDLRALLGREPMPVRKTLDLAEQIASGLATAHEKGIIHRDLKPENILVTKSGLAKIADFGLAKLSEPSGASGSQLPTTDGHSTDTGIVMGTVAYMSPEQARGAAIDFRSDQFAFGSILYEMLSGKNAFRRGSPAETLSAILGQEPEPLAAAVPATPAPLRWIVERCLSKESEGRFASTKDLATDLKSVRDHLSEAGAMTVSGLTPAAPARRKRTALFTAAVALTSALVALAFVTGRRTGPRSSPRSRQLTFRRGTVWNARFSPDGRTVLYSASFEGRPIEIFEKREDSSESRPLGFPGSNLLSVSRTGPLAISLRSHMRPPYLRLGTLSEVELGGASAPRELLDDVYAADWAPDGSTLAVVRDVGGQFQLEYPIRKVLYRTAGYISHPRVSHDGRLVAFLDYPQLNDESGSVAIVDSSGRHRTLAAGFTSEKGLAWSADGREVWFTASRSGLNLLLYAVTLGGKTRVVHQIPGLILLQDVSLSGKVLAGRESWRTELFGRLSKESNEVNSSWLDWSLAADISKNGKIVLFTEGGEAGGAQMSIYLRQGTEPAVHLGEGYAQSLSPDQTSVVAIIASSGDLAIYPTGVGEPRRLSREGLAFQRVDWMPDGKRLLVSANEEGKGVRLWIVDVATGHHRPISPERFRHFSRCVHPDGSKVIAAGPDGRIYLYPLSGGEPTALPGLTTEDFPSGWLSDGHSFFVLRGGGLPANVYKYDVPTGRRDLWKELQPPDPTGISHFNRFLATPDGSAYVYNYQRRLSELFEIEGLR